MPYNEPPADIHEQRRRIGKPVTAAGITVTPTAVGEVRRETKSPCVVHNKHIPESHINEQHHIWPQGHGGPTVPENLVVVCATGHNNIHTLLTQLLTSRGVLPYSVLKQFSLREREFAKLGYDRIQRKAL